MAKPNSCITKIRQWLASKMEPWPDKGEAWCVECSLSDRKNLVLNADGIPAHIERHTQQNPMQFIKIKMRKQVLE